MVNKPWRRGNILYNNQTLIYEKPGEEYNTKRLQFLMDEQEKLFCTQCLTHCNQHKIRLSWWQSTSSSVDQFGYFKTFRPPPCSVNACAWSEIMVGKDDILRMIRGHGYYLHNKTHPKGLGYMDLLVAIRETSTRNHFDPELIMLQLCDKNSAASKTSLKLNTSVHLPRSVCMGRVSLHDRINKRVDFFTFGGTLEAISIPGETVYWLHSPAPILEITDDSTHVANELASEIQLMLAVFQARWGIDDSGFAQRLEQVEPFECYLGGLGSILMRYQRAPALASSHHKLYTALLGEKAWLTKTGRWPASPLTLGALLLPKSTHRTN